MIGKLWDVYVDAVDRATVFVEENFRYLVILFMITITLTIILAAILEGANK